MSRGHRTSLPVLASIAAMFAPSAYSADYTFTGKNCPLKLSLQGIQKTYFDSESATLATISFGLTDGAIFCARDPNLKIRSENEFCGWMFKLLAQAEPEKRMQDCFFNRPSASTRAGLAIGQTTVSSGNCAKELVVAFLSGEHVMQFSADMPCELENKNIVAVGLFIQDSTSVKQ